MFSKTIFKQTLNSNWKLWAIFTAIMCILSSVIIAVFDPKMISSMMNMVKDIPGVGMFEDKISGMTSILGMLGQSFYTLQGILIPLIFIIMTANSLIASQVDRGSMAYILSTPTKRSTVVRTQAVYMISSVLCMFIAVTVVGLASVQVFHGGVFSKSYTDDVNAVSKELNLDEQTVADDLSIILKDSSAISTGAAARGIDEDIYTIYLNLKTMDNVYKKAAEVLGIDADEVSENPALIKESDEALAAAAEVLKMQPAVFSVYLDNVIMQKETSAAQTRQIQENLLNGINAAAGSLDMEPSDLLSDMGRLKENEGALDTAVSSSGIPKEMLITIINQQLASDELVMDEGVVFNIKDYIILNIGCFLLMFALSGISFMFSCIFNLSKNSLALGAGIPIAFFIFALMAQIDDSLDGFKYLTLNTLFDPNAIISGGSYWIQFVVLTGLGIVLYAIGIKVFKEKDLPL